MMSVLKQFDDSYRADAADLLAGFDEAGRGPLCGPLVAAGVILPPDFDDERINDSKKLTDKTRRKLFPLIKSEALFYYVSVIPPGIIDKINILEASRLGMQQAMNEMLSHGYKPYTVLTDFMRLETGSIKQFDLKHGDAQSLSIAAASILAKVTRDDIMIKLDARYPQYGLKQHKGYPTRAHLEALRRFGVAKDIYRLSYAPVRKALENQS